MAWWDDLPHDETVDGDDPYYTAQGAAPDPWALATAELDAASCCGDPGDCVGCGVIA